MAAIDKLLLEMLEIGGSDLHLIAGQPAKVRVHGSLKAITEESLTNQKLIAILEEICPSERWEIFKKTLDIDFAYEIEGKARFRTNYLNNFYGVSAVLRVIPSKILTMDDLKLPEVMKNVSSYPGGLVLVTGPTGSGKSTTMAAIIDHINKTYSKHIITIEDPIEFVHKSAKAVIVHKEVGIHSNSFSEALKAAIKSDPDIILLGEMRDMETIKLALTASAMGILVFATLHTNNAPKTIDRIIDAFPAEEQPQVKTMLSEALKAVISQLLCIKTGGQGRVAVHEILLYTDALPNIIRNGQISNIKTIIESNSAIGMKNMDNSLKELLEQNIITKEEAYKKASEKKMFL